jgi:DNA polymerase-1
MEEQIDKQACRSLLTDVELPLASVLARMEARGVRLDVAYLDEIGEAVRDRMATLMAQIYEVAGREIQPELAAAAAGGAVRELGLPAGEEDAEGRAVDRRQRAGEAP